MAILTCDIDLSAAAVAAIYRGSARCIQARARDGRLIRFPAMSVQRFVTHAGVQGTFAISIDADCRLLSVSRCE